MGNLLHYAIVFLVVALVAALFGFGGVRVRPHPRLWGVRVAFNFN